MRILAILVLLAACGPKHSDPPPDDDLPDMNGPPPDAEVALTEIQVRQNAACETVMPKLTACAVADARANMTPEQLAELDLETTAPIHTRELLKQCKGTPMSSRQVRVYEVCYAEETECGPLAQCLENAKPAPNE